MPCKRSKPSLKHRIVELAAVAFAAGCGSDPAMMPGAPMTGPGPAAGTIASGGAGTLAIPMTAAGAPAVAGAPSVPVAMPAAGAPAMMPAVPTAGAPSMAGAAGHGHPPNTDGMSPAMQHCLIQPKPDPRDEMLTGEPRSIRVGGTEDLLVPELVEAWMDENEFAESHDGWHLVRKWDQSCRRSNAPAEGCTAARRLMDQGLWRAPIQQGAPGDGLAFMMMHRHMIIMLEATFPKHAELFAGFKKVPRTREDPENPFPSRSINWTSDNLAGFDILENIEKNLAMFPTEDDLGNYIQNTYKWTPQQPISPVNLPGDGLHGALHAQWALNGSPANLIQQAVDVKNHNFWKLHGWIDDVWERYRVAKGLKDTDPEYQKLMLEQCMEMHALMPKNRGGKPPDSTGAAGSGATAPETGYFATMVRPILDSSCGGCHSAIGPSAGLTLGGAGLSSKEVRENVVGVKATNGEYALVEPGQPMKSWVYLKASGDVATVACTGMCDRQKMPPSGTGLTAAQLLVLHQWIQDGAGE